MAHQQEESKAANYEGLDRAEGSSSESTGHEVRFWRDPEDNVWEEILACPEEGRRRLAPDYCEFHLGQTDHGEETPEERSERLNAEYQAGIDELTERCGRLPFHQLDPLILDYHDLLRALMRSVGPKQLLLPAEEGEEVPRAYRVAHAVLDVTDDTTEEEMALKLIEGREDPTVFMFFESRKADERSGVWVQGRFIPDEAEVVEEEVVERPGVRLNAEIVSGLLEVIGLDENLERVGEPAQPHELKLRPKHDITAEERAVFNEFVKRDKENKVRVPREGEQDEWVWAYQWKSSGVAGWVRVGAPDSPFTYIGTERPEEVVEEYAEMFNVFNINSNLLGILEDEGVDLSEDLGLDEETINKGREAWKQDHSRSRKPKRRW